MVESIEEIILLAVGSCRLITVILSFFVVFFEKDNIPILCYNADEWEADGNLNIR